MKKLLPLLLLFFLFFTATAGAVCTAPRWDAAPPSTALIQYRSFYSGVAQSNVAYGVYTPAAYALDPERPFPVLYWLHGGGDDLTGGDDFVERLHSAIARGVVAPFIVVLVNGPEMFWTNSKPGATPYDAAIETVIIGELIPRIDANYRTIATRDGRGTEGFSMGGRGSTRLGFKYPELFSLVSNLAGAVHKIEYFTRANRAGEIYQCVFAGDADYFATNSPQAHAAQNAAALAQTTYRIVNGTNDAGNLRANEAFAELLRTLAIPYSFVKVPGVGHCYQCLYDALGDSMFSFFNEWASQ